MFLHFLKFFKKAKDSLISFERFAQVAQKKWAIVSELLRLLTKNEQMSKSLTKNEQISKSLTF